MHVTDVRKLLILFDSQSNYQSSPHIVNNKSTQTESSYDYEFLENLGESCQFPTIYMLIIFNLFSLPQVLTNSQLVLNILSINTPVNLMANDMKPVNCLSILTPIPEAISNDPSCSNLHELATHKDNSSNLVLFEHPQEQSSWRIYENDGNNSKSTDALLEPSRGNIEEDDEEEGENESGNGASTNYTNNISFSIIKENSNSNGSVSRGSGDGTEKYQQPQPIVVIRSRSGNKTGSKIYEPMSNESLTDSQGYMDDFDESCALIASERKRLSTSIDVAPKRNSLGVNKAPQIHRFSAGDADKLEKGIKSSLPSTRSLRDS